MTDAPVCPETGLPMVRGSRPLSVSYKGRKTVIDMPGWYCDGSGEGIHTREDMKVSDLALVTLKAQVENLATPEEVRQTRIGFGLSQAEASRIFGGGVRAFQKYESGEVLTSRAMTNLLRSAARHPEEVARFRADVSEREAEREST